MIDRNIQIFTHSKTLFTITGKLCNSAQINDAMAGCATYHTLNNSQVMWYLYMLKGKGLVREENKTWDSNVAHFRHQQK